MQTFTRYLSIVRQLVKALRVFLLDLYGPCIDAREVDGRIVFYDVNDSR